MPLGNHQAEKYVSVPPDVNSVKRSSATLPQTTQSALFTVTGEVRIVDIHGIVTVVIETQANNTKLVWNPTTGSDVDMCAVLNITGDAVGTCYSITGTVANAMVANANGFGLVMATQHFLTDGTIDLHCAASNTGEVEWFVEYVPVSADGAIVAA